ncbi:MAG: hypothetical protein SH818_00260 [Saprospiraceae bacterium]|nr:hypothetical protein [Saprospiraceae bacterium]
MKKYSHALFILLVLISSIQVYGQRGEKLESLRIAFITNKLSLTTTESEKFWPIYNVYRKEVTEIRRQANLDTNLEAMSDADAEKAIMVSIDRMEKELILFKNLARDLKPAIPARKIALLSKTERNFNEELIRTQLKDGARPGLRRN